MDWIRDLSWAVSPLAARSAIFCRDAWSVPWVSIPARAWASGELASKILEMVENASEKKASSEKFITRFARVYTPIVCLAAVVVALLPPLAGLMSWERSVYSALCFLVISCPCALVISVPLSFFAGIGRASREGVLVKGGNHLETLAEAQIVAFDKTGTLTEGRFSVSQCRPAEGISQERLLELAALAECRSTHPIAQSILAAWGGQIGRAHV